MTAIVMNTLNGAVSEYSGFDFHALTPNYGGSATGLYQLGGDQDGAQKIIASVATGKTLQGTASKKTVEKFFFSMEGSGVSTATVFGESEQYTYSFDVSPNGVSRATPGRGIRENYLGFGYSNADGAAFKLDRIEVLIAQSTSRRV